MGNYVQGKNLIVTVNMDGIYCPVFCAKSARFETETELIETTSISHGGERDYAAGMSSSVLEVTGVTQVDNTMGQISIGFIRQWQAQREARDYKITMTGDNAGLLLITFSGIIERSSFDKQMPGFSNSYVTIRACGTVEVGDIDPPPGSAGYIEMRDYWVADNGDNFIAGDSTGEWNGGTPQTLQATDEILYVDVEGTGFNLVTGTPAVGKRECKFITSPSVQILFPSDLVFDGSQRIYVMWKRGI